MLPLRRRMLPLRRRHMLPLRRAEARGVLPRRLAADPLPPRAERLADPAQLPEGGQAAHLPRRQVAPVAALPRGVLPAAELPRGVLLAAELPEAARADR